MKLCNHHGMDIKFSNGRKGTMDTGNGSETNREKQSTQNSR